MISVLALVLLFAAPSAAQAPDLRFPVVPKSAFGVNSLYAPEAVLPGPVGLNPATQTYLTDVKSPPLFQGDFGWFGTRSGLDVAFGIANYAQRLSGRDSIRVSAYGLWSNASPVPLSRPLSVEHGGQSLEFVYARKVTAQLSLGLAVVPYESFDTDLSLGRMQVASGNARSQFQARIGGLWHDRRLKLGFVYGQDWLETKARVMGTPLQKNGDFRVVNLTSGISYDLRLGTTLFYNRQEVQVRGEGVSVNRPISYFGVQQFLSRNWMLRYARVGTGHSVSAGYMGKEWEFYFSFTENAFSPLKDTYGSSSLVFLSGVHRF